MKQIPLKIHPTAFAAFGPDLVTNDVVALLELIKNCYDAYAYNVRICFGDENGIDFIEIIDDGIGMTRDTIENVWAVVATPYKRNNPTITRNGHVRRVSGNKGMGRFASARLGKQLDIYTKNEADICIHARIDWDTILDSNSMEACNILIEEADSSAIDSVTGTKLIISDLTTVWTDKDIDELIESISRIMSPFEEVSDFRVSLSFENNTAYKYASSIDVTPPEFINHPVYSIKADVDEQGNVEWSYLYDNTRNKKTRSEKGRVLWTEIYNNQINDVASKSRQQRIGSNRASCGPFSMEIRAWDLDVESVESIAEVFDINKALVRETLRAYKGLSVYRDGVLVLPKSESSRDWIGLDTRRISGVGKRMSTSQMLGIIRIGADTNPEIRDTTDREKLVDTDESIEFRAIILSVVGQLENLRDMDRVRKRKEPSLSDLLKALNPEDLEARAKKAIDDGKSTDDLLKIVRDYKEESQAQIEDVKKRLYYYGQVATAGSMSALILHEIRGGLTSIKRFMDSAKKLWKSMDDKSKEYFEVAEKSHERMLMVANSFAPLYSTSFRKKKHTSNLSNELTASLSYVEDSIKKHGIEVETIVDERHNIGLHSGEIQTVMVNLIDNAIYWVCQAKSNERKILIRSSINDTGDRIIVSISDTGIGVAKENAEKIFEPGVTAKPFGIGMGLVIVAEILAKHQGKIAIQIPGEMSGATFVFDVPIG